MTECNCGSCSESCKNENESAYEVSPAGNKPLSPVIDAEMEQCKQAIESLSKQIAGVYEHYNKLAEIAAQGYTARLAERCKELNELQGMSCLGKFWEQPEPRVRCDFCGMVGVCSK